MSQPFSKQHIRELGFSEFMGLSKLPEVGAVPRSGGVYIVALAAAGLPNFTELSVGGHFKRKDPRVDVSLLEEKWRIDSETVYIGKANNLQKRIGQLRRFGSGEPVGHWGGRYLWQLEDHRSLEIAWRTAADPSRFESEMIDDFVSHFDALPFANLVRGRRLAAAA